MPIRFKCTCGKVLRTPDASAGKTAKCPACGARIIIPAAPAAPAHGRRCPACGKVYDESTVICTDCGINLSTGERLASAPTPSKKPFPWKPITGAVAILAVLIAGYLFLAGREKSPVPAVIKTSDARKKIEEAETQTSEVEKVEDDLLAAIMLQTMLDREKSIIHEINEDVVKYSPREKGTTSRLVAFEQRGKKTMFGGGIFEKDETATPKRMRDPQKIAWLRSKCEEFASATGIAMENTSISDKSSGNVCFWKRIEEPNWETTEEVEKRRRDDMLIHEKVCSFLEKLMDEKGLDKDETEKLISKWCDENDYKIGKFHPSKPEEVKKPVRSVEGPAGTEAQKNKLAAAIDAGGGNGSCKIRLTGVEITEDEADVTIRMDWKPGIRGIKKGEVTVVFLFQPVFVAKLYPFLLALSRSYTATFPKPGMMRIVSGLDIDAKQKTIRTTTEKKEYKYALIIFCTLDDAALNLLRSGEYTFPIKLKESSVTGEPDLRNKGTLSVVVFKEDDPKLDHMKSTKYVQLSNEIRQSVDFTQTGRFGTDR